MLLLGFFQPKRLNYVMLLLALASVGHARTESNVEPNNTSAVVVPQQKSVKKELKVNITDEAIVEITPPNENNDHTEKIVIIDEKTVIESSGTALLQQSMQKGSEKTLILENATKSSSVQTQHYQHYLEKEISNDEDETSESLKTGFYFFLILSSGAIVFIVSKIYRLRLSRAERKYGVQGDRTTQELTPLPISIEDGHSDEEDQTLFDIQRENIRIL